MFNFPTRFTMVNALELSRDRGIIESTFGGVVNQVSFVDQDIVRFEVRFLALTNAERFELILMLADQAAKQEVTITVDGVAYLGVFDTNFTTELVAKHYNVLAQFVGIEQ